MADKNKLRQYAVTAAKIAVTAVFLFLVFSRMNFGALTEFLRAININYFVLSTVIYTAAILIMVLKWKILIPRYPYASLLKYSLIGLYYSLALPGQLAGDVVKAYKLGKGKKDAELIAASVVVDKLTAIIPLIALALAGIAVSKAKVPVLITASFIALFFVMTLILFLLRIPAVYGSAVRFVDAARGKGKVMPGFFSSINLIMSSYKEYSKNLSRIFASMAIGLVFHLLCVLIYVFISAAAGFDIAIFDWCWIYGSVSLLLLLPITVGGLGLREGGIVGLLGFFGIPGEKALALSLVVFALQLTGALSGWFLDTVIIKNQTQRGSGRRGKVL